MNSLDPLTKAPDLTLPLVGGGEWSLAAQTPESFTMIVVYRGYHCPVCKGYLGKLNSLMDLAAENGLGVVAVSMDGADRAAAAKEEWGLDRLDVAYGMSEDKAREWGLYISSSIKEAENDIFAEPGLFWITAEGTIYLVDVANMPFARPDLELLIPKASFANANGYPARGTKTEG